MTVLLAEVEDIQRIGRLKCKGSKAYLTEIIAQLHGRARTIAKLSNYLVAILNDRAHPHGIIFVVVVEGQPLLLYFLRRVDDLESSRRELAWWEQCHGAGGLLQ